MVMANKTQDMKVVFGMIVMVVVFLSIFYFEIYKNNIFFIF